MWLKKKDDSKINVFLYIEHHRIDWNLTGISFLGERKTFDSAEHSWAVANAWDQNLLTPKYRAEHFLNDFHVSGNMLYRTVCQHDVDGKCVDVCKDHLRSKVRVKKRSRTTEPRCLFRGLFTEASLKGWGQFIYQYSQGCECRSIQSCWSPQTCHQWTAWWWAEGSQRYIIKPASCSVAGTVDWQHPSITPTYGLLLQRSL